MGQKGFGHILVILGFIVIAGSAAGLIYYLGILKNPKLHVQDTAIAQDSAPLGIPETSQVAPLVNPSPNPIILRKTYTSAEYKYTFIYPAVLNVQSDSEEDYFQRNGGDARANFTNYVKYAPGKLLSAVSVLGKDSSFENSVFTIWIFDNPTSFTPDEWFNKYWYYPFLWGVFDRTSKGHIAPEEEATISGASAIYKTVSYQPLLPKYLYLLQGGKMFLIRTLTASDHTGESILETFKFTNAP